SGANRLSLLGALAGYAALPFGQQLKGDFQRGPGRGLHYLPIAHPKRVRLLVPFKALLLLRNLLPT
ncbi:MAG: hypothetical protein OER96_01260, partial [Gammaproteobacteria bacterium]|nr:hypothetical protein [Gammaproteobacteria bacterium]